MEYEYTVQTRYRLNQVDEDNQRPMEPNWGPWSRWSAVKVFPTLAGAAMSAAGRNTVSKTYHRDPDQRIPYAETQARVAYRQVPSEWTPIHEEEV